MVSSEKLAELQNKQRMGTLRILASRESGATNCSVIEAVFEATGNFPPHYHDCEEILVFLEGEGTLFVGQEPRPVFAGMSVIIPAGTPHCFYNTGIGRVRLMAIMPVGEAEFVFVDGLFTSGPPVIATEEMFAGML